MIPLRWTLLAFGVSALLTACSGSDDEPTLSATALRTSPPATQTPDSSPSGFALRSSAFADGQTIPEQFTCEGDNLSPALSWTEPPAGTQSYALIVDDPDAPGGTFTHWLLFDLPATTRNLPQSVERGDRPASGGVQGTNDGNRVGYTGPCPPAGTTHHYNFTLTALDATLGLDPGANVDDVLNAMEGHILAQAEITGTFAR